MKNKVFFKWIYSYILIFSIPIILMVIIYFQYNNILSEEVAKSNGFVLKQTKQTIDERIREIQQYALVIATNYRVEDIVKDTKMLEGNSAFEKYLIVKEIKNLRATNEFIDDVYIYFKKYDIILSTSGWINSSEYFSNNYNGENIEYSQWYNTLQQKNIHTFLPLSTSMMYILSLPTDSTTVADANLVILIDKYKFENIMVDNSIEKESYSFILDKKSEKLITSKESSDEKNINLDYNELSNNSGLMYKKINNKNMIISYAKSDYAALKYVNLTPYNIYNKKVVYIKIFMIIIGITYIILCIIAIFYIMKKNYSPIKLIASMFSNDDELDNYDEYNYIQNSIKSMIYKQKELLNTVDKQREIQKNYTIINLLKSNSKDDFSNNELLTPCGIKLSTSNFIVILFLIEDYSNLFEDDKKDIINFVISNVTEEIFANSGNTAYSVEIDGMNTILVNLKDEHCNRNYIENAILTAKTILNEKMFIYYSVSYSNIQTQLNNIQIAYREVLEAIKYKKLLGDNSVIAYEDIKNRGNSYYYDIKISEKLLNSIKVGSTIASNVINETFNKNFIDESINITTVNYLIFNIANTILTAAQSVCDDEFINKLNLLQRVEECNTVADAKFVMLEVISDISNYIKHKDERQILSDRIISYIDINYADNQMNVNDIGDRFNITPSYMSKIFKEQTGVALSDYINKIRIDKAKELLHKGKIGINKIAENTGYVNSNVFIRNFKKVTGITPGQYKELN